MKPTEPHSQNEYNASVDKQPRMRRQGGFTVALVVASACSSSHRAVDASSPEDVNTSLDTEIDTRRALDSGVVADGNAGDWGAAGEAGGSLDSETAGESGTPFTTTSFTQISAGSDHTCGLRVDGSVTCWGSNSYGQAVAPSGTFAQLSAGDQYTCGLRADGSAICWGKNTNGQAAAPAEPFTQISVGREHACGLRPDDTVLCWGDNSFDQATPPPDALTQISAGTIHTCGLRRDGSAT